MRSNGFYYLKATKTELLFIKLMQIILQFMRSNEFYYSKETKQDCRLIFTK